MATLHFHENPSQGGDCLSGAFAAYAERIPTDRFRDLDSLWRHLRRLPFEVDSGDTEAGDGRCSPVQRSRVWPNGMNCWELAAHFAAGALRFLGDEWEIHIWDRQTPYGRHVWPSLVRRCEHYLVDLSVLSRRQIRLGGYMGLLLPSSAANGEDDSAPEEAETEQEQVTGEGGEGVPDWVRNAFGGVHLGGKMALTAFGLGGLGDVVERLEGDALPTLARSAPSQPPAEPPPARKPSRPAGQPDQGITRRRGLTLKPRPSANR